MADGHCYNPALLIRFVHPPENSLYQKRSVTHTRSTEGDRIKPRTLFIPLYEVLWWKFNVFVTLNKARYHLSFQWMGAGGSRLLEAVCEIW